MKLAPPPITTLPCIPPGVVAAYVEAYGTCAILPGHALVQVRGALAALVEAWLRHLARGTVGTLADQTARLVSLLRRPDATARAFYEGRVPGSNLGARPEQRFGAPEGLAGDLRDEFYASSRLGSLMTWDQLVGRTKAAYQKGVLDMFAAVPSGYERKKLP